MKLKNAAKRCFVALACCYCLSATAQADTTNSNEMERVVVVGYKGMKGIGHLNEVKGPFLYTGKKTEVIVVDSIDANKAINNTRQILGRIPGLNIVESETGGFVANGIGVRGLNPVQSLELDVRQNGYNVAADVYGYNETYYLPPMEAVERVEFVKGASSLQYGSQLGGMVNYVLKDGSETKPFTYSTAQTGGSAGLFNSYHAIGGTVGKFNYSSFLNYRTLQGWRPNSNQQQFTGFGKMKYKFSEKLSVGLEYSLLRNKIKMPGGLTDSQFETNSQASVRSRNWLKSPWNILSANAVFNVNKNTSLNIVTTYLAGERSLVWFNALPGVPDGKNPLTDSYSDREIDREIMKSGATEVRLVHEYRLGKLQNTLVAGTRISYAKFTRLEEAPGTNRSDFDLAPKGEYEEQYVFKTFNLAAFFENRIQIGKCFSVSPGLRFESLATEAEAEYEVGGVEKETEQEKERSFVLGGIGLQYEKGRHTTFYGNLTQSFRPVDYAQLFPFGTVTKVDPYLKDPKGWNADIGVRGTVKQFFNYDIGVFYLRYTNRIGNVMKTDDAGSTYVFRTNQAQSIHKGLESYLELNITRWLKAKERFGKLSIYHSFAYTDARYNKGEYKGNRVEYAPKWINRIGLSYEKGWFSSSVQYSDQSKAYGDAANTERSSNPVFGRIPAYHVFDLSATGKWKRVCLKAGVNNLTDERYFTQRTDEYPGPGIIPSVGRSIYVGLGLNVL